MHHRQAPAPAPCPWHEKLKLQSGLTAVAPVAHFFARSLGRRRRRSCRHVNTHDTLHYPRALIASTAMASCLGRVRVISPPENRQQRLERRAHRVVAGLARERSGPVFRRRPLQPLTAPRAWRQRWGPQRRMDFGCHGIETCSSGSGRASQTAAVAGTQLSAMRVV